MACGKVISRLIKRCGREVQFPGKVCFKAYLEPVREHSDRLLPSESGVWHSGKWLFMAPIEEKGRIEQGMSFESKGESFLLERLETMFLKDEAVYLWGLVSKGEGGVRDE